MEITLRTPRTSPDVNLDRMCMACNGTGRENNGESFPGCMCGTCGGIGYVLTDAGKSILKLVLRHQ